MILYRISENMDASANVGGPGAGGQGNDPPEQKFPGAFNPNADDLLPAWVRAVLIAIFQRILQLLGPAPEHPQFPAQAPTPASQPVTESATAPAVLQGANVLSGPPVPVATTSQSRQAVGERQYYFAVYWGSQVGVFVGW